MSINCTCDQARNLGEAYFPGRKSGDGGLVGGIQDSARGSAAAGHLVAEAEGREAVEVGFVEVEGEGAGEVEPGGDAGEPLWVGEGVLDRGAHVGRRKLR